MKRNFVLIFLIMCMSFSFATKIGWIDSNRIMQELDEVREVEIELEKEQRRLQAEMENLISELDSCFCVCTAKIIFSRLSKKSII